MNKISSNFEFDRYGLHVRLVQVKDARFILDLRTNPILSKHLHVVNNNLKEQEDWIAAYKLREQQGVDYYFIYEKDNEPIGVNRLYNIESNQATAGSWICKPGIDEILPIYTIVLLRDIMFEVLNLDVDNFDVRKGNKKVQKCHELFGAQKYDEDIENIYYKLTKEDYLKHRNKILTFLV